MKSFVKWSGGHIIWVLFGSFLYLLTFHIPLFNKIDIYFYRGIVQLFFTAIILVICEGLFIKMKNNTIFGYRDVIVSVIVFLLANMLLLSLVLVSLDRSLTVFLLCYMEDYDNYTKEELDKVFQDVFIEEFGMLDRRFDEQLESGTIVESKGVYELSNRGRTVKGFFQMLSKMYGVDEKFTFPKKGTG